MHSLDTLVGLSNLISVLKRLEQGQLVSLTEWVEELDFGSHEIRYLANSFPEFLEYHDELLRLRRE
jgi:hypothetical protein